MRGRTYQFNVNRIAAAIAGTAAGSKMKPVDVAARACDIADAVYGETKVRNAGDMSPGNEGVTLHTAEDILGEAPTTTSGDGE
jgi:hypothetical protein